MFQPWKTASQTVAHRLLPYGSAPYGMFFSFNPYLQRVTHQHLTCADFVTLPEAKLGYLTASFIRNPYDRAYSGFLQLQEDAQKQPGADFEPTWIGSLVRSQIADNYAQLKAANFHFDDWMALLRDEQIYDIGRNTNFPLHPACYWTHYGTTQLVEFLGRVETFESDFERFRTLVKIEHADFSLHNVRDLIGGSLINKFGYRYTDRMARKSVDKINNLFANDFELFGYDKLAG